MHQGRGAGFYANPTVTHEIGHIAATAGASLRAPHSLSFLPSHASSLSLSLPCRRFAFSYANQRYRENYAMAWKAPHNCTSLKPHGVQLVLSSLDIFFIA